MSLTVADGDLENYVQPVRVLIILFLPRTYAVIGIDLLSQSLLPAIVELAEDKQWRVRQAIIEYIPLLANQLGVEFFDEQLSNLCMSWLGDTVFSIREAATVNLKKLTDVFGVEWARQTIIPKVLNMGVHPNYLYRMTTIFAITTMAPSLNTAAISDSVLETVLSLTEDPIPNIRFNVAKAFEVLASVLSQEPAGRSVVSAKVLPALEKLKEDLDADVRFFAGKALTVAVVAEKQAVPLPQPAATAPSDITKPAGQ